MPTKKIEYRNCCHPVLRIASPVFVLISYTHVSAIQKEEEECKPSKE